MKNFFKEFREFINRGNVIDLAVAVVIGGAFTSIVNSVVNDLIMPLISLLTGGIDFSDMKFFIGEGPNAAAFCYGNFISALIQFLIITLVVFLIIRGINRVKRIAKEKIIKCDKKEEPDVVLCPYCKEEVKKGATKCPHCTESLVKIL